MNYVKKYIGEGLKNTGPNLNVLNVLRTLIENKNTVVYIPDGYKKSTNSGSDPKVHFYPSEAGRRIEVVGITSNQTRFNFSLLGLVNVLVEEYLPNTNEVQLAPKKVWRQYNIIRDSKLMFDYIIAKLDKSSFDDLRDADILYYNGVKVPRNHCYNSEFLYKVMLKDIPLISLNWAQPVNIGLYNMMKEDISISQNLKAMKAKLKELNYIPLVKDSDIYTESLLKSPNSKETEEYYDAECIVYRFPDLEKENFVVEDFSEYSPVQLSEFINDLKNNQKHIRFMIRCVIMAIENSKKKGSYDWSDEYLVPRSKNKYRKETMVDVDGSSVKLVRERSIQKVSKN